MAITKEKKKEIIAGLEKAITKSKTVVFVNFNKLLVKDASIIRRSLKSENVGYVVAKKSLFRKVLDGVKIKGNAPDMKGELALAYGEDLITYLNLLGVTYLNCWKLDQGRLQKADVFFGHPSPNRCC